MKCAAFAWLQKHKSSQTLVASGKFVMTQVIRQEKSIRKKPEVLIVKAVIGAVGSSPTKCQAGFISFNDGCLTVEIIYIWMSTELWSHTKSLAPMSFGATMYLVVAACRNNRSIGPVGLHVKLT